MLINRPPPHLEIEALSIDAKLLHQRERCGLQHVDLQGTEFTLLKQASQG